MKEEEKAYIKEIVREVMDSFVQEYDSRLRKVEQKVFNGFGLKINILYAICLAILTGVIKLAFF